jgi:hypothetical protein
MPLQLVKLIDPIQMTIAGTFTPKGAYDNATNYAVGDQVDYNGTSYIMYNDAGAGTVPTNTSYWGIVASKGDTGATGAQGDPGEDANFVYPFTNESTVVVEHNLGKYPSTTVIDSADDEVEGRVTHDSINQLTLTFTASFTGKVICN